VNCNDVKELTVPYLELDLDGDRVHQTTVHLESCAACRREMETVRQVLVKVKGVTVPDPGERFWKDFPATVRRELRMQQADTSRFVPLRSMVKANRWPLALAASLLLLVGGWLLIGHGNFGFLKGNTSVLTGDAGQAGHSVIEVSDLAETDWARTWDEDDPDMTLIDLASGMDPGTLDRLFRDI
jgi:predicted anti-sigma-YlaC factor YlaD